jgi:hypothetical protein
LQEEAVVKGVFIVVLLLVGAVGVYFLMSPPRISSQQAPAAAQQPAPAGEGRGRGISPEQQAALDK